MSCNKDEFCKNIVNEYATATGKLNSSFAKLKSEMNDIGNEINGVTVPNDYLGGKVSEKLAQIKCNFDSDKANVESAESSIISFVNDKKNEHQQHYDDWLLKKDDDNGTSVEV